MFSVLGAPNLSMSKCSSWVINGQNVLFYTLTKLGLIFETVSVLFCIYYCFSKSRYLEKQKYDDCIAQYYIVPKIQREKNNVELFCGQWSAWRNILVFQMKINMTFYKLFNLLACSVPLLGLSKDLSPLLTRQGAFSFLSFLKIW